MNLGSLTDWISAGCNVVMAGAASYAAANAKDWLSTKINDKKFKFADDLIDKFCCLQQEGFYLHADVKNIINTDPELQGKAKDFSQKWQEIEKRESIYRRNIINVRTEMERMALWGLKPVNKNVFKEVIDSHLKLTYKIADSLSIGANETRLKLQNYFEYDRELSLTYQCLRGSHNNIIKHYSELFVE